MTGHDVERYYRQLTEVTARLADVAGQGLGAPVPTCPGWTMRDMAVHVGRGHRWAAQMVETRATQGLSTREVTDGRMPDDPARHGDWLTAGAARLVAAVHAAPDQPVWTFVGMRPARFWARRRAQEVTVHLADALLAVGQPVDLTPDVAADGIDEWLALLAADSDSATGGLRLRAADLAGDGQTLHVHATDDGLDGIGEWLVTRTPEGVAVAAGHAKADVAVRGPALDLLLVLTRRLPLADSAAEVFGDEALFAHWIDHTRF